MSKVVYGIPVPDPLLEHISGAWDPPQTLHDPMTVRDLSDSGRPLRQFYKS